MDKILLIDGNSIMNRAYFGIPDLTNASGLHTNAVYGFLNIIFKFIDEEKPTHMAIAFDLHAPTFRHKMYAEYKGTRKGMPDELREQVPYIKNLVRCLNITIVEKEGYEADDILGTLAKKAQEKGMEAVLVSGDRDLLQISDEHIKIRIPKTIKGQTTVEDYYPSDVFAKYNVTPKEFIDLKALMGDSSDNIPGVPKVGEKTAAELISRFHSIDSIYEHIDEISKPAIRNSFVENKDLAYLCLKLVTIEINAPVNDNFDNYVFDIKFTNEGLDIVKKLNIKSYIKRFEDNMNSDSVAKDLIPEYTVISDLFSLMSLKEKIKNSDILVFSESAFGTGICIDNEYYFVSLSVMYDIHANISEIFNDFKGRIVVSDAYEIYEHLETDKFDSKASEVTDRIFSLELAAYLINPLINDYTLKSMANDFLFVSYSEDFSDENSVISSVSVKFRLYEFFLNELQNTNQLILFEKVEMPLSLVLFEMEQCGIACDKKLLIEYKDKLNISIEKLETEIYETVGHEFNIQSPKQLGVVLFEELKLSSGKKTKTGYSTSADVLNKLAEEYPVVQKILDYRALTKLKSTYAEGLSNAIASDGRIHSHFLQTVTATGRISSAEPNLQNIPVKTEIGRELRKVFIPKPGFCFADADYSQIELRVLAHLSKDSFLTEAFNNNEDIHSVTASAVFNVSKDEITPLMRRTAKVVNFGIIYGMSSFSLGQDLQISKKEADKYIEDYFAKYPGIKFFLDDCIKKASDTGYSVTDMNRRRPIPELKSSQFMQKEFGKRVAMNAPVQGTAADIMKIAMINVRDTLILKGLESRILIQVHDELLLEVKKEETEVVTALLKEEMEKAYKLCVPLLAELQTGDNWYEAK